MSDLLQDFVAYFVAQGLVTADGVDIFRDMSPEAPDTLVAVYEYGSSPTVPQVSSVNRSVQIVARSLVATDAKTKARALYSSLVTETGILDLTATRWCMIQPRNTPFKIKVDAESRIYYGFNIGITTYND